MVANLASILTSALLTTTPAFLLVVYATRLPLTLSFASVLISGQPQAPSWLHADAATSTARGVSILKATLSAHLAYPVSSALGMVVVGVSFPSPHQSFRS